MSAGFAREGEQAGRLDFQPVIGPRHQRIERRHQENADQQPRDQAADNHQRERLLGIGANAGGQRRRQQARATPPAPSS